MDGLPERLLIFTGNGKGKTTAALGMVLRAAGHNMRTLVVQFIKNDDTVGEVAAVRSLPQVDWIQAGHGFVPRGGDAMALHRRAAEHALATAREGLASGRYALVLLDELCIATATGLIDAADAEQALRHTAPGVTVVLTGRGAPPNLVAMADTVTEMRCVKHGYKSGIAAQAGVEF